VLFRLVRRGRPAADPRRVRPRARRGRTRRRHHRPDDARARRYAAPRHRQLVAAGLDAASGPPSRLGGGRWNDPPAGANSARGRGAGSVSRGHLWVLAPATGMRRSWAGIVSVAWGSALGGTFGCLLPEMLGYWHLY